MINNFALIVGAMKCGTSSLYQYISSHPQVCPCIKKEPKYFSSHDELDVQEYNDLWPEYDSKIHKIALEASTTYTKIPHLPNCAERIARFEGRFKFIYVVRNPFDRIKSTYIHGQIRGWKTTENFSRNQNIPENLIDSSKYYSQIKEYYSRFPNENIFILTLDDLHCNRQETLLKIFDFLGLDKALNEKISQLREKIYNSKTGHFLVNKNMKKMMNIANHIPVDNGFRTLRNKLKPILGKPVDENKYLLSSRQREEVYLALEEDMMNLRDVYGVDVEKWGFNNKRLKV